ncbi:MAG: NYN domain-containing protein [Hydrogenothermus sp.]|nr:MAG: NYN domain-containing protein [Hydrogenothermus sp.]
MLNILKRKPQTKQIEYRYINERVAIFIDAGNMFHASNYLKIKIDYKKLINLLKRDRWLLRAYFYTGIPSQDMIQEREDLFQQWKKQEGFLNELQKLGIKVKTMPLKKTPEGYIEKGVDVLLATDMVSLAFRDAYDTAILVSGDSDYVPVVEEIQELGKRVENASFKRTSSYELRKVCDSFLLLDNVAHKFTMPLNKPKQIEKTKNENFIVKLLKKLKAIFSKKEEKK